MDKLSEDHRGRVVVLSGDGDVLNIFNGSQEVKTDKVQFELIRAITTPSDHIVVSNLNTDILLLAHPTHRAK